MNLQLLKNLWLVAEAAQRLQEMASKREREREIQMGSENAILRGRAPDSPQVFSL